MNIVARTLEFITENLYYFINLFSKSYAIVSNAIFGQLVGIFEVRAMFAIQISRGQKPYGASSIQLYDKNTKQSHQQDYLSKPF